MEHKKNEHGENREHSNNQKRSFFKNTWQISTIILGVVAIILVIMLFTGKISGKVISGDQAGEELVKYLNQQTNGGVEYVSNIDKGNAYEVTVKYQGKEFPLYITKDGKYLFQNPVDLADSNSPASQPSNSQPEAPKDIVKSDKPQVDLFVMTHCPYGTQSEKGILPTIQALGSKVDFKIRFVHYFMHGDKEEKETYNQACIREEQSTKYLSYLGCFLASTGSEDDAKKCLDTTNIDKTKLNTCISSGKGKEYYEVDKKLSNSYGVQGSPTLVINGVQAESGRDSSSYLKTICGAFNDAPTAECTKQLSSASPSPGFGTASATGGGSPSSAGGCASA
jgi:hypothetical protein